MTDNGERPGLAIQTMTTHYEDGEQNSPKKKNFAVFIRHGFEHMGIDNRVINRTDYLE
jgi:hypothetical protein